MGIQAEFNNQADFDQDFDERKMNMKLTNAILAREEYADIPLHDLQSFSYVQNLAQNELIQLQKAIPQSSLQDRESRNSPENNHYMKAISTHKISDFMDQEAVQSSSNINKLSTQGRLAIGMSRPTTHKQNFRRSLGSLNQQISGETQKYSINDKQVVNVVGNEQPNGVSNPQTLPITPSTTKQVVIGTRRRP